MTKNSSIEAKEKARVTKLKSDLSKALIVLNASINLSSLGI
jgi:hypothetical protein